MNTLHYFKLGYNTFKNIGVYNIYEISRLTNITTLSRNVRLLTLYALTILLTP